MAVPANKLKFIREKTIEACPECSGAGCRVCNKKIVRLIQYAKSNIPVEYWNLAFKDFKGDPNFRKVMKGYLDDIDKVYYEGTSFALVGKWGVGKTFAGCAMLKIAIMKGFSVKFFTMTEIINSILSSSTDSKVFIDEITNTDFICIDEYDKRWVFPSEKSEQIFGQTMENILRVRFSNKMPTIICSNTPDVTTVTSGTFSSSIDSLISKHMEVIYVAGKDFRKTKKNKENS